MGHRTFGGSNLHLLSDVVGWLGRRAGGLLQHKRPDPAFGHSRIAVWANRRLQDILRLLCMPVTAFATSFTTAAAAATTTAAAYAFAATANAAAALAFTAALATALALAAAAAAPDGALRRAGGWCVQHRAGQRTSPRHHLPERVLRHGHSRPSPRRDGASARF